MTKPIRLKAIAERDLIRALEWYDGRAPGTSDAFLLRVQQSLDLIYHHPEIFAVAVDNARRAPLRQFPYAVVYRIEPDAI